MERAQLVVGIALGSATILGLGAGLIRKWLVMYLVETIRHLLKEYLSELKPDGNGGHNLRGRVDRIEQRVDKIYEMLLEDRLAK
jgi:hypothetical protein